MIFKAKIRRIGNSKGIILPLNVITGYNIGDEIELDVITNVITNKKNEEIKEETNNKLIWCKKHNAWNITCGCKE